MKRFRNRLDKRILIDAMQYSGGSPQVPHKFLRKNGFFISLFVGTKWLLFTSRGYLKITRGDFILRRFDGSYDVLGPKLFANHYERI